MNKPFSPGDRVVYSDAFLRSAGERIGDLPQLRGIVIQVSAFDEQQLCTVLWLLNGRPYPYHSRYDGDGFGRVIAPNLTRVEM